MKTPHAILIGLSLIAAAIFFKDTAVKPASAFYGATTPGSGVQKVAICNIKGRVCADVEWDHLLVTASK